MWFVPKIVCPEQHNRFDTLGNRQLGNSGVFADLFSSEFFDEQNSEWMPRKG